MSDTAMTPQFERLLSRLMLAGVWSASLFLAVGLVTWLSDPAAGAAGTLLRYGLLVLMATPMLRVALSVVEAARQRDWFSLAATFAVLAILLTGTLIALRRG
jgi:hypothetical protein